ncbi:vWA domain-containing protein, partial [Streptomyces longispororuber]|uniref:vWA domain-containing protein n=1 Tax=Streptomyces longispororuber TaxID=68230 RepID=UPI00210E71D3
MAAGLAALLLPAAQLPADPVASGADRAARSVPSPTDTTSVVTVKVGGDRNGDQSVAPLAGTTLGLYATETGGSAAFTCTSDADGDCSFIVTGTGTGGALRGQQMWVRQISAPGGWFVNDQFRTSASTSTTTPYRFRTPALYSANTYSSTATGANGFMVSSGSNTYNASGGTWQQSRNNPALPQKCGLKVALVMDLSGSMNGSVGALKTAANTFVDALQGTPSSMAKFTFSSYSPATNGGPNEPGLRSVSTRADAAAFKQTWAHWTESTANGATNWDRALYEPALAGSDYDVAVVITDGMPTRYSTPESTGGNGSTTRVREVENGIFSANALKAKSTRVLAVGVGSGVSGNASYNLASLSGKTKYDGTNAATADYYQEADFDDAGKALRDLALANCTPSLSVVKQIQAEDGTVYNAPEGWTFDGSTTTEGVTVDSPQTTTNDGTGAVNFPLDYSETGTESARVRAAERQQAGYQLIQQDGKNAVCYDKVAEQAVEVTNDPDDGTGFEVDVPVDGSVTCSVLNKAPAAVVPASVQVDKEWQVTTGDGTRTYPDGEQPGDLQADLSLTGPGDAGASSQGWGVPREGYSEGDAVTVAEQTRFAPKVDCELTGVDLDGRDLDTDAPSAVITLEAGANTHKITNHVACTTRLTLAKRVSGGDADPTSWDLRAIGADGALPGPAGAHGSPEATAEVSPDARYQLAEQLNSDDPELLNYKQVDERTDFQSNPLSTGSMNCLAHDKDGNELLGWNDGINGGVNVPLGVRAVCTAVNETVPLTLRK